MVILAWEWFGGSWQTMTVAAVYYALYLRDTMKTLMKRGERVIPVFYGLTPSTLMPVAHSIERIESTSMIVLSSFPVWQRKFLLISYVAPIFADLSSIFASITALDLGRYDG